MCLVRGVLAPTSVMSSLYHGIRKLPIAMNDTTISVTAGCEFQTPLLSLVCDLHDLSLRTQCHTSNILLGRYSTNLSLIFNKSNTLPARNQSNFLKPFESSEDGCKCIDIVTIWQVLCKENFVWWEVFVGNDCCCRCICRFQAGTTSGLCRSL